MSREILLYEGVNRFFEPRGEAKNPTLYNQQRIVSNRFIDTAAIMLLSSCWAAAAICLLPKTNRLNLLVCLFPLIHFIPSTVFFLSFVKEAKKLMNMAKK